MSLGLSQAAAARHAGISPSYLSRIEAAAWENGGPWPSPSVIRALARVLSVSSGELMVLWEEGRPVRQGRPKGWCGFDGEEYSVSIGASVVARVAAELVAATPPGSRLRLAESGASTGADGASRVPVLAEGVLVNSACLVWRVCPLSSAARLPLGDAARTRCYAGPSSGVEVLIAEGWVLLVLPGSEASLLPAAVAVNDPDFVGAARAWFDEELWDLAVPFECGN